MSEDVPAYPTRRVLAGTVQIRRSDEYWQNLEEDLRVFLNSHGVDSTLNTPDYELAEEIISNWIARQELSIRFAKVFPSIIKDSKLPNDVQ